MKFIRNLFLSLYKGFVLYSLLCFALLYWFPLDGWFSGFIMISFPLVVAGNVLALILLPRKSEIGILLPIVMLALSALFLPRTFQTGLGQEKVVDNGRPKIKLLSYNVGGIYHYQNSELAKKNEEREKLVQWIGNSQADILFMPEYINGLSSGSINITRLLKSKGYEYVSYLGERKVRENSSYTGMALFSKYPIGDTRDTTYVLSNGMMRADIKVGKNTIRVIGVHLYSMTLESSFWKSTDKAIAKDLIRRISNGFIKHAEEARVLKKWVQDSPYPVIVAGDFNETPYSYVYGYTRSYLTNAFEKKGKGFGFTFRNRPYFIRIDNQFYDQEKFNLIDFKTENKVLYSDHYPLMGTYQLK